MIARHARWMIIAATAAMLAASGCSAPARETDLTNDRPTERPAAADAGADAAAAPMDLGPTAPDEQVQFTVSLRLPAAAELGTFLAGLADPSSPDYRRYLKPDEFGARFGLPDEAVARVVDWLESAGLSVAVMPQRTSLTVGGPARVVNELLGVTLVDRLNAAGIRYHLPLGEPNVPGELGEDVAAIIGLDTEPVLRPALGGIFAAGIPGDGLTPAAVARAYEIEGLHQGGLRGEGQTVAIVSFDTFTPSDVDRFDEREGLNAPRVEIVRLDGAATEPGAGTGEVALDITVIRGIAPQAQIINYEGPNTGDGFAAIIARIVADGRAEIVSISWGLCERYTSPAGMAAEQREFAAAFAAGLSIFAASGDDGAYDCRRVNVSDDPFQRDLTVGVDWPSSSPSVIGVGGTFLSVRQDGTYLAETGWEEPLGGGGGGGGLSAFHARPPWQAGTGVENAQSNGMRQVPDVAGPADPSSGFLVVYTEPGEGVVAGRVGGTSAAAPFWAASMLLTRQLAEQRGVETLGALGPALYQVAAEQPAGAVLNDVIRGGNLLYSAGPGWDYSTGLGTPRVTALAQALVEFLSR